MRTLRGKAGQGMAEYVVILALVAVASIGAVIFFADNARRQISSIAEEIGGADATVTIDAARQAAARYVYEMGDFTTSDGE